MESSRKRGRDKQEDEAEFTPLSKRINNLHINSNLMLEQQEGSQRNAMSETWGIGSSFPDSPPSSVQSVEWNLSNPAPYDPELTESQNPFYFNSNKLLYEMYIARLERNNQ